MAKESKDQAGIDPKLKAFTDTVAAIAPLDRPSRLEVLRAVAQFHGLVIPIEPPR